MQALFDVGQIEVLRGPQGTLRGRASPSGSITITTQRPLLDEFGGFVDLTATDTDSRNVRGALNVPIVQDMLAVRVAGFWEENDGNQVENVFTGESSDYEGKGYRVSVGFEPLDTLRLSAVYQKIEPDRENYFAVESATVANPNLGTSDIYIDAGDRLAVHDLLAFVEQEQEAINLQASWDIGDHQLNYVYAQSEEIVLRQEAADIGNAIDASHPASAWQGAGLSQGLDSVQDKFSHEIRLQSIEPLFDRLDYIVGFFYNENEPGSDVVNRTPLAVFVPTGNAQAPYFGPVAYSVAPTNIFSGGKSEEMSYFGNLTYQLTDATEVSAGLRRIDYENERTLVVGENTLVDPGSPFDDGEDEWQETIYSFSLKHNFSDDLMAYFNFGTSWRPGISAVGDFSLVKSDLQRQFTDLPPEESESFEVGVRATMLDQRLRLNASVFHQEFDNYPYRAGGGGIYYVSYEAVRNDDDQVIGVTPTVNQHNFVAAVPVEVNGVELEAFYQLTDSWDVGALYSYAKGEIDNGTVPCNDYLPNDGIPDEGGVPTLGDIMAAAGSDNLTSCSADFRANFAPLWTATLTSEYSFGLGDMDAYVRGLWTIFGDSKNDPTNDVDDVDSYNILNLYAGVREPAGAWEAMIYAKNVFDTDEVVSRDAGPEAINFTGIDAVARDAVSSLAGNVLSDYREIQVTAPREFGVNFRYNF